MAPLHRQDRNFRGGMRPLRYQSFHVDAFSERLFAGNPACVVPLESWPDDRICRLVAMENAVAETAFFVREGRGFHLRWFTPDIEMDLCGHATLAAAHVIIEELGLASGRVAFRTASGPLEVVLEDGLYWLDFPSRPPVPAVLPEEIAESLGIAPLAVYKSRDYLLEYASEEQIRALSPRRALMDRVNLDPCGVVATAPGDEADFVSRFFTPQATIFEDPVTGSAHCSLIPFWAERLGRTELRALQLSARGGELHCRDMGARVRIGGAARTYETGTIRVE
jgi:PhzF family phenazine biosynthesis protein